MVEMIIRKVTERPKVWNRRASHPLQTWEWGEFRKQTGVQVVRYGIFDPSAVSGQCKLVEPVTVTIHQVPHTPWTVGYYPKGGEIGKEVREILERVVKEYNCLMIKCEPKIERGEKKNKKRGKKFVKGKPLFTKYNFELDVTKSEEELLKQMKQKTRYNVRLAKRKGVKVEIDNSEEAFERYLELTKETTKRQGFFAHSEEYHRKMWKVLREAKMAELVVARYKEKIITTWIVFCHNETMYYPYGASTREHSKLMANNLVMWEVIKLAKRRGMKTLDMWGALGPEPDKDDPWYGFHKFKEGYGARQVTYVGTWDYVARPLLYYLYRLVEWGRWIYLKKKAGTSN